uniref:HAD-IA family hydrolase n=1 Tax=Candidatus Synechococcus spongiarum TaxID=431041 RepID=UPI00046FF411
VVSNFDRRLDSLLERLWLRHWFTAVVISSRCGVAKPDPRLFHMAVERLGLLPHQVWHLGDAKADAQGARAAGIRCILVQRTQSFPANTATGMMEA